MLTKRLLILAPLLLVLFLLQAYFWVPNYEAQGRGNPARLGKFIEASIGDAKLLNPALHADASSGRIVELVFEGLVGLDENLALRGRVARDWTIGERAYLAVDPARGTAGELREQLQAALERGPPIAGLGQLTVAPAETREVAVAQPGAAADAPPVKLALRVPPRLRLDLDRVDQDLWEKLAPLLGVGYGDGLERRGWLADPAAAATLDPAVVDARLAEALPLLEHNPEITFRLRPGVRWHDGEPIDADDVRFTYQALMDPLNLSPRTSDFEPIKRVETPAPDTVRVVYKRLFSPAINAWTIGLLPEHRLNRVALEREAAERGLTAEARARFGLRDSRFNRAPVGSGPFRFVEWQGDELIHLARNDDYWGGAPRYRDFYYRVIPDALTQEVEFRSGAVDSYLPQPHQVARYRDDPRYQNFSTLGFGYTYIGYNTRRPLFADPRVRRALGMALDVDEIIRYVLYGEGERVTGPYPKNTRWYDPAVAPLPYDPAAALAEFAALGWRRNADGWLEKEGRRFEFNLITNNGNLLRKAVLSIAQNGWRKIGVKVNVQLFEWAVFLEDFINSGDFDAVILGWSMGIDPDLYQLWHSSQAGSRQLNFVGYANPRADALIERIRREYDPQAQQRLARELHRLIADEQPYTFLYAPLATRVLDRKIAMVAADGRVEPLKPTRTGDLFYHFNRWQKFAHAPTF